MYARSSLSPIDKEKYYIVRTYSAGVHIGEVVSQEGTQVVLKNSRRIWSWEGAFTLSEMSVKGVEKPENCKFSCEVDTIILTEAIELIPCTEEAEKSLKGVKNYQCN